MRRGEWILATLVCSLIAALIMVGIVRNAWANTVQLTSTCGQVQVLNDHNHDRVTLSRNGVVHYTFKNNGTYNVTPGTYDWEFFHGARPNGDHGMITVPSCVLPTTTTTSTSTSTSTSTTTVDAPTTTTTEPVTTTTECQDHTLPCAGPPVTFPVHPVTHPTTTTVEIGTAITATQPVAVPVHAQPVTTG